MPSRRGAGRTASVDAQPAISIAGAVEACRKRLAAVADAPWLEARLLASHVTGLDASAVVAYGDNLLDHHRAQRLADLAARRIAGEPLAYLVGFKDFCGARIEVDRRVLVPRPETEELVAMIVANWKGRSADILDLGTGSGAIAIALARRLAVAQIWASDVSLDAIAVARANVDAHLYADRITVVHGDLFEGLAPGLAFDVIAANLPYVAQGDEDLAPDVMAHEPSIALFGGSDGLDVYRRMLALTPSRLKPGGALYCECGPRNAYQLAALARSAFAGGRVDVCDDLSGLARMVVVHVPPADQT